MKFLVIAFIILVSACTKDESTNTLYLNIKTPFRTGTITIDKDGSRLSDLSVLADSERSYIFYDIPQGTKFLVGINRDIKDTGIGNAILNWKFIKSQSDTLYFETFIFNRNINYVAQ